MEVYGAVVSSKSNFAMLNVSWSVRDALVLHVRPAVRRAEVPMLQVQREVEEEQVEDHRRRAATSAGSSTHSTSVSSASAVFW